MAYRKKNYVLAALSDRSSPIKRVIILHIDVLFQVRVRICPNGKVNRARSPFSPINKLEDDQNDNR